MSDLFREVLRRYQQADKAATPVAEALAALRAEARQKGLSKLTTREINAEITAARKEMYGLKPSKRSGK